MTNNVPARRSTQRPARKPREPAIAQEGSFYKAGGREVPDARKVQRESNEKNIPYEILHTKQTKEYAEVIVRAYAPNGQYIDDVVHHDFDTIGQLKALEMLKKQVAGDPIYLDNEEIIVFEDLGKPFDEKGRPLLTGQGYLKLLTEMARFRNFSIRDAVTKAARRAQLKVLNKEWRNEGEIKAEQDEIDTVNQIISEEQSKQGPKKAREQVGKRTPRKQPKESEDDKTVDAEYKVKEKPEKPETLDMTGVDLDELKGINKNLDKWIKTCMDQDKPKTEKQVCAWCEDLLDDKKLTLDEFKQVRKALGHDVK
ncbi:MAG: hypothetical protein A4E26_00062 [Methanobacterium sp. PtaU1.Bin097]|uniref:Uncharacterized protein n=1 Tax=candidate division WWE3 bacterium TaxID=2053526 RepID=A0A7X9E671_UNCKA|nr:hypothetical protein [candidate division WWE3 bacterium]OPY24984.1 MAG: hypothetical protein A4E26_00062 [Methanobacterium sp. PtaU1.Bin097]